MTNLVTEREGVRKQNFPTSKAEILGTTFSRYQLLLLLRCMCAHTHMCVYGCGCMCVCMCVCGVKRGNSKVMSAGQFGV